MGLMAQFRVWFESRGNMVPGPSHLYLADAVARARELAAQTEVSVELPGGQWYLFPETSGPRLGPLQSAMPAPPRIERRTPRLDATRVFSRARCTLDDVPAEIDNVSEGGFGVSLRNAPVLAVGRTVRLAVSDSRVTFSAEVTVAWVRDGRAGLALSDSGKNVVARSFLRQLVRRANRRRR